MEGRAGWRGGSDGGEGRVGGGGLGGVVDGVVILTFSIKKKRLSVERFPKRKIVVLCIDVPPCSPSLEKRSSAELFSEVRDSATDTHGGITCARMALHGARARTWRPYAHTHMRAGLPRTQTFVMAWHMHFTPTLSTLSRGGLANPPLQRVCAQIESYGHGAEADRRVGPRTWQWTRRCERGTRRRCVPRCHPRCHWAINWRAPGIDYARRHLLPFDRTYFLGTHSNACLPRPLYDQCQQDQRRRRCGGQQRRSFKAGCQRRVGNHRARRDRRILLSRVAFDSQRVSCRLSHRRPREKSRQANVVLWSHGKECPQQRC